MCAHVCALRDVDSLDLEYSLGLKTPPPGETDVKSVILQQASHFQFLQPCHWGAWNIKCEVKQIKKICGFLTRQRCFPFSSATWRNGEDTVSAPGLTEPEDWSRRRVKEAWGAARLSVFLLDSLPHHHASPVPVVCGNNPVLCWLLYPLFKIKGQSVFREKITTNSEVETVSPPT